MSGFRIDVAHGLIKDRRLRNGEKYLRQRPEVHEIFRRWQEIAGEYIPKPTLMGETYVLLDQLFDYYAHLDLVQNFPFLRAEFDLDELRPDRRDDDGRSCRRDASRSGSGRTTTTLGWRLAGRAATSASTRPRSFCILTLPGSAILYQGDELGLEDGHVPADRILDLADPPRDPERTPFPWTRSGEEWRSPWLPLTDTSRNAEDSTILPYTRELIAQRKELGDGYRRLESDQGVWAYARGDKTCVLNMTGDTRRARWRDTPALAGADPAVLGKG